MFTKTTFIALAAVTGVALSTNVFADTCPTELKQDSQGYWFSDTKPGWKSHKPTPSGITLKADDFGGVVYSPKRNRIACVYKASDGKWVALVSNIHHGIVIDKKTLDDSGKKPAWKYSSKHEDYACGQPDVMSVQSCQFQLAE